MVGMEAAKRFYTFWYLTYSIILAGHFLYFTGRSVFLYSYGKGLHAASLGVTSPGISFALVECLVLFPMQSNGSSPLGQLPKIATGGKGKGSIAPLDNLTKEEREERDYNH
jgi:hypothetical protein